MNKKCPSCGSSKTKKKGFKSGVQRYLCRACKRSFVSTRRPSRLRLSLWKSFIWKRDTVKLLAARHSRSVHWIRKELRAYELPKPIIVPDKIVAIMDCVFLDAQVVILSYAMLTIAAMCIGAKLRVRQSMSISAHEIHLKGRASLLMP